MTDEHAEVVVDGVELIDLSKYTDDKGSLVVAELGHGLPFAPKRMFTVLDVPELVSRGTHAHRECAQFLVCLRGTVVAVVDDGTHRQELTLSSPAQGLHMPAMTWGTQYDYSHDAILLVLASDLYDVDDYIDDYKEFRALRGLAVDV